MPETETEIRSYTLTPTRLIPNSPYPLIHYPNHFNKEAKGNCNAAAIHQRFASNGWQTQWIYRYAPTQPSHYHSATHECMAVLSGSATIRFGVADTEADDAESPTPTHNCNDDAGESAKPTENGNEEETIGILLPASPGDVFLIPAGVAHKTIDPRPTSTFALLTSGNGHGLPKTRNNDDDDDDDDSIQETLARVPLSGFTMLGAYPLGSVWDFSQGGDHVGGFEGVWRVPKPERDPVVGEGREGLCGLWGAG